MTIFQLWSSLEMQRRPLLQLLMQSLMMQAKTESVTRGTESASAAAPASPSDQASGAALAFLSVVSLHRRFQIL